MALGCLFEKGLRCSEELSPGLFVNPMADRNGHEISVGEECLCLHHLDIIRLDGDQQHWHLDEGHSIPSIVTYVSIAARNEASSSSLMRTSRESSGNSPVATSWA